MTQFVSTRGVAPAVDFRTALFKGLAPDGGLYVPEQIESLPVEALRGASLTELGVEIATPYIGTSMTRPALSRLLTAALDFPIPTVSLDDGLSALELFHGPTFAFKDVGARVMARLMAHFNAGDRELTVLVATSGDTGSAVAQAFFGLEGTRVIVLFPDGGVTPVQEAQFTTLGGNVTAVAVSGTFDDCQRLVKEAFASEHLEQAPLTSANSINVGRLLPQVFYYAHAALQSDASVVMSVPSGNFGNLTAGLWAWKMGVPIRHFIAATTINDTGPRYLHSGVYEPRPSVPTLANAMDVGSPSNLERIRWLFEDDLEALRRVVHASVHTDADVRAGIRELWNRHRYVTDPHTAIAYLGLTSAGESDGTRRLFLSTAHAAKFREIVEPIIGAAVPLPQTLGEAMSRPRLVRSIQPRLSDLVPILLES
jgi:threonine synthase